MGYLKVVVRIQIITRLRFSNRFGSTKETLEGGGARQHIDTHPLEFIIRRTPDVLMGIAYDIHHFICSLSLIQMEGKPISETPDGRVPLK